MKAPSETPIRKDPETGDLHVTGPIPAHPLADTFAMMGSRKRASVMDSIKRRGVQKPIVLMNTMDGVQVVDGRNRLSIALELKIPCPARLFGGDKTDGDDVLDFILTENIDRRTSSKSQRAMEAARICSATVGRPRNSTPVGYSSEFTVKQAASRFEVSAAYIESAKRLINQGPASLISSVDSGEIMLSWAVKALDCDPADIEKALDCHPNQMAANLKNMVEGTTKPKPKPKAKPKPKPKAKPQAAPEAPAEVSPPVEATPAPEINAEPPHEATDSADDVIDTGDSPAPQEGPADDLTEEGPDFCEAIHDLADQIIDLSDEITDEHGISECLKSLELAMAMLVKAPEDEGS